MFYYIFFRFLLKSYVCIYKNIVIILLSNESELGDISKEKPSMDKKAVVFILPQWTFCSRHLSLFSSIFLLEILKSKETHYYIVV